VFDPELHAGVPAVRPIRSTSVCTASYHERIHVGRYVKSNQS
jgi:hypothetical protein